MKKLLLPLLVSALILMPVARNAACCYFSGKTPTFCSQLQKVFINWDPVQQLESFTVQPKFEGNGSTSAWSSPRRPNPNCTRCRDFFKHLAVFSIMKKRAFPHSKLLPLARYRCEPDAILRRKRRSRGKMARAPVKIKNRR